MLKPEGRKKEVKGGPDLHGTCVTGGTQPKQKKGTCATGAEERPVTKLIFAGDDNSNKKKVIQLPKKLSTKKRTYPE